MSDRTSAQPQPTDSSPHYTRKLTTSELRGHQLRLLDEFAEVCRREEIEWFLCAGTLLGAVRHGGYIPWDDDIDVMLPRAEFERVCAILEASPPPGCGFVPHSRATRHSLPYSRLFDQGTRVAEAFDPAPGYGVNIDIFPIDHWPSGTARRALVRGAILGTAGVLQASLVPPAPQRPSWKNLMLALSAWVVAHLPLGAAARFITACAKSSNRHAGLQAGVLVWGHKEQVPVAAYAEPVTMVFEGRTLPAPAGWKQYLSIVYGDYESLPPTSQQVSHHTFEAFGPDQGT